MGGGTNTTKNGLWVQKGKGLGVGVVFFKENITK